MTTQRKRCHQPAASKNEDPRPTGAGFESAQALVKLQYSAEKIFETKPHRVKEEIWKWLYSAEKIFEIFGDGEDFKNGKKGRVVSI